MNCVLVFLLAQCPYPPVNKIDIIMKFPITFRKSFAAQHEQMDPYEQRAEIFEQLFTREFPVEFLLAAEIAQLRSFTFPHGTRLLHQTGEFEKNSLKRLDDTRALLVEMGRDGFLSERGRNAAAHLNEIHSFYDIPNDEFLHTLSTFIYDVWMLIGQHGWRKLTRNEELAIYYTYLDMGKVMNIKDIPDTFEAFWEWRIAYELENQAYSETNHLVAEGLMRGAREMLPVVLRPFLLPFVLSLEDQRFAELLGYEYPNRVTRAFVNGVMWIYKQLNKVFTVWDVLSFEELLLSNFKTYPNGYKPMHLGPTKLMKHIRKRRQTKEMATVMG